MEGHAIRSLASNKWSRRTWYLLVLSALILFVCGVVLSNILPKALSTNLEFGWDCSSGVTIPSSELNDGEEARIATCSTEETKSRTREWSKDIFLPLYKLKSNFIGHFYILEDEPSQFISYPSKQPYPPEIAYDVPENHHLAKPLCDSKEYSCYKVRYTAFSVSNKNSQKEEFTAASAPTVSSPDNMKPRLVWIVCNSANKMKSSDSEADNAIIKCEPFLLLEDTFVVHFYSNEDKYTVNLKFHSELQELEWAKQVSLEVVYEDSRHLFYECVFRFVLILLNTVVLILFLKRLFSFSPSKWSLEQKWIGFSLLLGLMAFNDPIHVICALMGGTVLPYLSQISRAFFLSSLFTFWLVFTERLSKVARPDYVFPLRCAFAVNMWFSIFSYFTAVNSIPIYYSYFDLGGCYDAQLLPFYLWFISAIILYKIWVFQLVVQNLHELRNASFEKQCLYGISFFVLIASLVLLLMEFGKRPSSTVVFVSLQLLLNGYVYFLAVVHSPSKGNLGSYTEFNEVNERKNSEMGIIKSLYEEGFDDADADYDIEANSQNDLGSDHSQYSESDELMYPVKGIGFSDEVEDEEAEDDELFADLRREHLRDSFDIEDTLNDTAFGFDFEENQRHLANETNIEMREEEEGDLPSRSSKSTGKGKGRTGSNRDDSALAKDTEILLFDCDIP